MTTCGGTQYEWNGSTNKGRSSTTGNVYGIYDMASGAWEYVMGSQSSSASEYIWYAKSSGFTSQPNDKYFDKYLASVNTTSSDTQKEDQARGLIGDATRETIKIYGNQSGGWYEGHTKFASLTQPWFERHGYDTRKHSIYCFGSTVGSAAGGTTFRVVISAEDK